jgi:hypothetical protein
MSALCALRALRFKRKSGRGCAETVDAVDSLWKRVENQDADVQILGAPVLDFKRSSGFCFTRPLPDNGA